MTDLLFQGGAAWFSVPALIGTLIFLLRIALMLVGGDADTDLDFGDADVGDGDSSGAFEILSVQSIAAFAMGFGWGGLASLKGTGFGWPMSVLIGCAIGVGMVWLLAILLKGIHDLQSSGNISIDSTMGLEGEAYTNIPARGEGRGRVKLVVHDRQRMFGAVSDGDALPSRTRVVVTRVNSDNTITVSRA